MPYEPTHPMNALLATMPDGLDWPRLTAGARELLHAGIRHAARVPESLIEWAFEHHDEHMLGAVTANNAFLIGRPQLRARLAATGSRRVAANWASSVTRDAWTPLERRALFANADPTDDAWIGGAHAWHEGYRHHTHLRAAVTCRVRNWAGSVLSVMGRDLSVAEQLRALLSIIEGEGRDAVNGYLERDTLWPRAAAALLDPDGLPELTARLEGVEGLIPELSDETLRYPAYHLALREKPDWDAILAAHADTPFPKRAVQALTARPDCPDDAIVALYSHGTTAGKAVEFTTPALLGRGNASWAVDEARPAAAVLKAARGVPGDVFRRRLAALVHDVLGTDVRAWRTLRARLGAYPGTIAEMFAEIPTAEPPPGTAWPEANNLPERGKRHVMRPARQAFLVLLDVAPVEAHLALLPHLDDRTVYELFTLCAHRPEWAGHVRAHGTREQAIALASGATLSTEDFWWLSGLGEPRINIALRDREAALRPRDAVGCADKDLQWHILSRHRLRGEIPQLRLLLNHWERHGAEDVRTLLARPRSPVADADPFSGPARKRMERLLTDEAVGLRKLRAFVERGESPEGQTAMLRGNPRSNPLAEHHAWHWDTLLAEHQREPFPAKILRAMPKAEGCPEPLRAEAERTPPNPLTAPWDLQKGSSRGQVTRSLNTGAATWPQVLAHGTPAPRALEMLADAKSGPRKDAAAEALSTMVMELIGADSDAWAVALAMLPDFTGTLPELLRTASLTVNGAPE